jgi:branched-chain amino acid transport system substrate-binding protein
MRDMSNWRRSLVVVVAAGLAAAGCTNGSDSDAAAPPSEVRIGLLVPMSGPNKAAGADAQRGAQLAADVVNGLNSLIPLPLAEDSGLTNLGNARIRIIVSDSKSDPARAASETTRLAGKEGVAAVVGSYDPDVTLEASQRAERIPVPFVNGDSSVSFLAERGLDWFFHTGPSVRTSGEAFFSLLKHQEALIRAEDPNAVAQIRKVAVLHADDKAGNDVSTVIAKLAEEGGLEVVADISYSPSARDLNREIAQVQQVNPDAVIVAPTPSSVPELIQAFAAKQYKPNAVLAYGSGFLGDQLLKQAGAVAAGLCREAAWSYELAGRNTAARAVATLYQTKYNTPMTEEAASTFTAVHTLAMAINNAGSNDVNRVKSALLGLDVPGQDTIMPWQGIRFDDTHQNVGAASVIEQFVSKSFHAVYPRDSAGRRELVWPASNAT